MGRDFKIGLMSGTVLGFVALVWVATRPSQSPQARMLGPSAASSQEALPLKFIPAESDNSEPAGPAVPQPKPGNSLPPSLTAPQPQASETLSPAPDRVASRQSAGRPSEQPDTTRYEQDEKITTIRFHIVQRGETLSAISQQYYGSATRWQKILEANPDAIKDANKISPGTKLIIPW